MTAGDVDGFRPDPFVALMRRYCIDYTNRHDLAVCDEIMAPDYSLHMGEHHLHGRDDAYKPAVERQLLQFPGLGLLVHEIFTNGESLAMRFSEHGASVRHDLRLACWSGIGIYRWDGTVLVQNWVEQDYYSRRAQLAGEPRALEPPALDPWITRREPADPDAEELVRSRLLAGDLVDDRAVVDDGSDQPRLDLDRVDVDDLFSAGRRVGFHATLHGTYRGGLPGLDRAVGTRTTHSVAGIVQLDGGRPTVRLVTDRLGLARRLDRDSAG